MRLLCKRAQPPRRGRAFVGLKGAELTADTRASHGQKELSRRRHCAVLAENMRHIDGETGIADPACEARDMRADSRHFGHHDDGGAAAHRVDAVRAAEQDDLAMLEIVERVVAGKRACWHYLLPGAGG